MTAINTKRTTYRHGNLRQALLEAGIALAREGGPRAVVLREATRQAGVVPNAAYRHFANHEALFNAVRGYVVSEMAKSIEAEIDTVKHIEEPVQRAQALLAAVGRGYVNYALREPNLFITGFATGNVFEANMQNPAPLGASGMGPFQLLSYALDEWQKAGLLDAERRENAEFLAWSSVHGIALMMIDGPLKAITAEQRQALLQRVVNMVVKGL